MKSFLSIISILLLPVFAYTQRSDTLPQQSINVINEVIKSDSYWILLVKEIEDYIIKEMKSAIGKGVFIKNIQDENGKDFSKKLVLSKKERRFMKKTISNLKSFQWSEMDANKLHFNGIRTISSDSSLHPSLDIRMKYRIVPPIFIRNNEYCFLYLDYACGLLCGGTRFEILKRTTNGWKLWDFLILSNS